MGQDIISKENVPDFDRSPLDGYAYIADDAMNASNESPVSLKIAGEIPAGHIPDSKVLPGTAIKISTGAPIPENADVITRYEDTVLNGGYVKLSAHLKSGCNIIVAGADVKSGDTVATKGTVVNSELIGLLASTGIIQLPVFKKAKIAIFSTGSELIDISEPLVKGKIRNSSIYSLSSLCHNLGVIPVTLGTVRDNKNEIAERFSHALQKSDMVISTGGVSVGDYDLVKEALNLAGAQILFWRIAIKPGTPTLVAVKDGKPIICLSGNPAAALAGFDLLVIPAIKKMMGYKKYLLPKIQVLLSDDYTRTAGQRRILRARLFYKDGKLLAGLTGLQNPGILKSMIDCNILIDVPKDKGPLKAGDILYAFVIREIDNFNE